VFGHSATTPFLGGLYYMAKKLDPSGVCFGWYVLELAVRKRIFQKTKKADQNQCENWRCESGSEFHKTSSTCERVEWTKQLQEHKNLKLIYYHAFVFCSIPRLFVYLRMRMSTKFKTTFMCLRSIAGVPFDSVWRFRATLLLHTTCVVHHLYAFLLLYQYQRWSTPNTGSVCGQQQSARRVYV